MKNGADVEASQKNIEATPLHVAAAAGWADCVVVLLENYSANINDTDKHGRTALHHACMAGKLSCVHELMTRGADVEARTKQERLTPLHMAALKINQIA